MAMLIDLLEGYRLANKTKEKKVSYNFEEAINSILDAKTLMLQLNLQLPSVNPPNPPTSTQDQSQK